MGINVLHELGSLVKSLGTDLALLASMLFLVRLQFPGAGKRLRTESTSEDRHDDGATDGVMKFSTDALLLILTMTTGRAD